MTAVSQNLKLKTQNLMLYLDIYLTRLFEDKKDLANLTARCPLIQCRSPRPDLVAVRFEVAGLHRLPNREIITANEHLAEIYCPPEYPVFTGPLVRMTTPGVQHWHPNIDPITGFVCYGIGEPDQWAPSIGLDTVILLLARMLRLEVFNLTSVIDRAAEAAEYVRHLAQEGRTPLDVRSLGPSDDELMIEDEEVEL